MTDLYRKVCEKADRLGRPHPKADASEWELKQYNAALERLAMQNARLLEAGCE